MSCRALSRRFARDGITLVELLVALAIIGVLLAITIPAILASRETARKVTCVNQLHQLGTALLSFESSHGYFPTTNSQGKDVEGWIIAILPDMGQAPLRQKIREIQGDYQHLPPPNPYLDLWTDIEKQLLQIAVPGLHCPSDPSNPAGTTSYPGNDGIWPPQYGHNGVFRTSKSDATVIYNKGPVRAADITDGLSMTLLACEWLPGPTNDFPANDHPMHAEPRRWVWELPLNLADGAPVDVVVESCRQVPPITPQRFGWRFHSALGSRWFYSACGFSTYNHAMTPNTASCRPQIGWGFDGGLYTAASYHRGGVNAVYADGHVEFISDSIDATTWRDRGSRAQGNDLIFFDLGGTQ